MAKDVKCEVNSCYYWASGDKCHAEEILVNYTNRPSMKASDVEFGLMGEGKASTDNTCCETFRPKKKA